MAPRIGATELGFILNITDFAKQIGVSRATVWRALSGQGPINDVTRKLVLEKAEKLGLRPNRSAHAFATGRSYLVELWIKKMTDFAGLILKNLEHALNNDGFDPIVRTWDSLNTKRGLGNQYAWPVDGVIAVDPQDDAFVSLRERFDFGTPVVNIGGYWVESTDFVGLDLHSPTSDAVNSLIASGCKRVAYVSHSFGQQNGNA